MHDILSTAVTAAREAGEFLLSHAGAATGVEEKPDKSLVTDLDKKAEEMIAGRIRAAFPGHDILGEEGSTGRGGSDWTWVIDPLDGTHNFIRGIDLFGVSIGVVYKGAFVAGAIHMPAEHAVYAAEKGGGAFRNGARLAVSPVATLDRCSIGYDSTLRTEPDTVLGALRDLGGRVFNVRMFGSSVRNLTWLAAGKIDAIVEFDDKPWDFAGGVCLVREAGGAMTSLDNRELSIRGRGYVATNGAVHDELMRVLRPWVTGGK